MFFGVHCMDACLPPGHPESFWGKTLVCLFFLSNKTGRLWAVPGFLRGSLRGTLHSAPRPCTDTVPPQHEKPRTSEGSKRFLPHSSTRPFPTPCTNNPHSCLPWKKTLIYCSVCQLPKCDCCAAKQCMFALVLDLAIHGAVRGPGRALPRM